MMNLSGTVNAFRLLYAPKLARPHVVLPHFNDLTFPLHECVRREVWRSHRLAVQPDIRAVVVDKDNCFARKNGLEVWPQYRDKWDKLVDEFGPRGVLIVSNTSGAAGEEREVVPGRRN
jgi:phosphatidylglycerophosphatase GEP4